MHVNKRLCIARCAIALRVPHSKIHSRCAIVWRDSLDCSCPQTSEATVLSRLARNTICCHRLLITVHMGDCMHVLVCMIDRLLHASRCACPLWTLSASHKQCVGAHSATRACTLASCTASWPGTHADQTLTNSRFLHECETACDRMVHGAACIVITWPATCTLASARRNLSRA